MVTLAHRHATLSSQPRLFLNAVALAVMTLSWGAMAQTPPATRTASPASEQAPTELGNVVVRAHYDNSVGSSDAASEGAVTASLLANRPTLRPAEVLEFVPGLIVTQHSGGGKANQYFLRGFNLDHGTDFATYVDGMPINMPTHAHGQGYSDMNWLMPELVQRINYRKGPYFAEEGDFSSAGAARIRLVDSLPQGVLNVTAGQDGYRRALVANSSAMSTGTLLYAFEAVHNDGPWEHPEDLRKLNGLLRYSVGGGANRTSLTAMAYDARWNSTDQIPLRAIEGGLVGRYGALDPSDGGRTSRQSLSLDTQQANAWGTFKFNAYAIHSRLKLFSNFEYANDDEPDNAGASQFEQAERRQVVGLAMSQHWTTQWGGFETNNVIGLQARHDRMRPLGLYEAEGGERTGVLQESRVRQRSVGLYAESSTQWQPWLRSVLGLRADHLQADVDSAMAANSGQTSASLASPKLSLILGPWEKTEYFINAGTGFHSNDARGTTVAVDPVPPLVRSKGLELGLRTEIVPGLQSSLAWWQLKLGSELVFVGDAGTTEANRASKRQGIEWNNHYVATDWLQFDLDLAASQARFTQDAPEGNRIPGALEKVASLGVTVNDLGRWHGQFQLRYFGPRPLIEDNSVRSSSTTLAYARVGYRFSPALKLDVDVFNLFNRKDNDIEYFYASRLPGEAAAVDDRHIHPVEPRTLRVTLSASF